MNYTLNLKELFVTQKRFNVNLIFFKEIIFRLILLKQMIFILSLFGIYFDNKTLKKISFQKNNFQKVKSELKLKENHLEINLFIINLK